MRLFTILALLAGLGLATALIASSGAASVGEAVASAGWGVALVAAVRAVQVFGAGAAWWALFRPASRPRLDACALVRWIRESVNNLLPVAQVGGDVLGARLLGFFGVDRSLAAASVIVDMLVQVATQFIFAVIGLLVLIGLGGGDGLVRGVALGLLVAAPAIAGFYLVQRRGMHRSTRRLLTRLIGTRQWTGLGAIEALYAQLETIHTNVGGLALGAAVHLAVWIFGTLEIWIALAFMGWPVGFAEALVIESLAQAVRGAAFMVPGALGVQEGGFVALCAVFGIPAPTALALSLVKRVVEALLGIPGLLAWQALEGHRLMRRRRSERPARQEDAVR